VSQKNSKDKFLENHPGSPNAVALGCSCPQAENNFGRGRSKNGVIEALFTADPECPIHGFEVLFEIDPDFLEDC
jgi:hypothetical protein